MKSYSGTITKEAFVNELKWHQKQDNSIKRTYENGEGKGCAVGCSIMSINKIKEDLGYLESCHKAYEEEGICPKWLAHLEDRIFEGVSIARSKSWPVEFAEAINEGSDLDKIKVPFLLFIMGYNLETLSKVEQTKEVKKSKEVISQTIEALKSGDKILLKKAGTAAWSAEESVWVAESVEASEVAWVATGAAAWSASAAWSAWSEGTAEAAQWAAEAVNGTARTAAYELFADKLLELIKECK
jgi:hypothetical protein